MLSWGMSVPWVVANLVEFLVSYLPKMDYLYGILADVVLGKGEKVILFAEWPMVI
jgi:hypothetical protein